MKKIITFLLSMICLSFSISTFASEQNIYPIYYGTKKCQIDTTKEIKQPPVFYDKENYSFYLEKNNLYKNEELYQTGVSYLYMEYEDNVFYGIENGKKIDLYKNKQKLLSAEYINHWSAFYDEYEKKYALEVTINQKNLMLTNDTLVPVEDYEFHTRYFSENKNFFIDVYQISNSIKVVKNNTVLYKKLDAYVREVNISNDGKNVSFIGYSAKSGKEIFVLNGKEIGENIYYSKFSPSGKNLYTLHTVGENMYDFYKNNEKIGSFNGKTHNYFDIVFKDDDNFYFILTDWDNYALIQNGKTRISYDDPIQVKAIIKKENGDLFIVKRDKILGDDILEINGKEVLRAKKIDERYLDNGKHTFSLFPNKYNNSSEYNTFINDQNDNYFLIVNSFIIPNFYDYLQLKDGLNDFRFASLGTMIKCQDITYLYPNINISRDELEKNIFKILKLSPEKTNILEEKLNKMLSGNLLKEENKEILQMLLDNLKNKSIQIYAK